MPSKVRGHKSQGRAIKSSPETLGRKETRMKIVGYTKCNKCGKVIAVTEQVETDKGFDYIKHNKECRYIDRWGFERNFCKKCMR